VPRQALGPKLRASALKKTEGIPAFRRSAEIFSWNIFRYHPATR
jgi:hypothetical protein